MPWSRGQEAPATYQSYAGQSLLAPGGAEVGRISAEPVPAGIWRGPLRQADGLFSTFVYSHDPRNPDAKPQRKITSYDFAHLCRWGGVLGFFTRAGVLRASWSLITCLVSTLGFAFLTAVLVSWHNKEEDMDLSAMDTLQQRVNIMVTFILGFFVQLNVARWWNHRDYLRQLQGSVADILLHLNSLGVSQDQMRNVARLGLLAQALLFDECRGVYDSEPHVPHQTEEDAARLSLGPPPSNGPYAGG
eukprot:TRINITY_DN10894_c0_g1_i1.p1 TRINITY_DN10894_c0_g1~~TRINITY_DN10894_c0_g1_i1.p1  ORF type:complete len:246 (+),score=23.00 TRINITY_DN10894_c0_g1_i1:40-777(+)